MMDDSFFSLHAYIKSEDQRGIHSRIGILLFCHFVMVRNKKKLNFVKSTRQIENKRSNKKKSAKIQFSFIIEWNIV